MRRSLVLAAVCASAVAAAAACSLTVDTTGLTGGSGTSNGDAALDTHIDDANAPDTSVVVTDTGTSPGDTSTPLDTSTVLDTNIDANPVDSPPGATDMSAPCAQQNGNILFCDDFDSIVGTDPGGKFDWEDNTVTGGTIAIEKTQNTSPPNAVGISAPPVDGVIQLGKGGLGAMTKFNQVDFDLRLDEDALTGVAQIGIAQLYADTAKRQINFVIGPGESCYADVYDESSSSPNPIAEIDLNRPKPRTWTRIGLIYDVSSGVTITYDGKIVGSNATVAAGVPGATELIIGAAYVNSPGTAPNVFELDNVVVRGQ